VTEVVSVHPRGTLEATYADPGLEAPLRQAVAEARPDCVHVQHLINLSGSLLAASRAAGARVVFTLHDYWLSCPRDGLRMREDLGLCREVDHAVCARCLETSPYLVPAVQRGVAGAVRGLGLGRWLHRLHAGAPRLTQAALRVLRHASPSPAAGLPEALRRRARALQAALDHVDLFLAPTAFARDRAVEFGVPAARTRVLPLGVLRSAARPRPAGPRPRIGYVGSLLPHKGVHVLVGAFRGLERPEARLQIHGSETVHPEYARRLRSAAAGDPRIAFHGPFREAEQERVFAGIDALAVPSLWWENSPLTVLEALGAGRPVVASRTGGVPELVGEDAGVLVPPGEEGALREALDAVSSGSVLGQARGPLALATAAEHAAELEAAYRGASTRA
jgi:glycosyltransferase involved in cell wall biosynthesis